MFMLDKGEAVLVIVDVQERLAAVMEKKELVVANILHLVTAADLLGIPVIVTEQYPKGLGPTIPEIRGALKGSVAVEKIDFSCCNEPAFVEKLAETGRKKIILTGMETHVCVLQTCTGLLATGFTVHVIDDAVCSRSKRNYKTGIQFMRDSGAVISCTETVLFQLLVKAGTEQFRVISKRIK